MFTHLCSFTSSLFPPIKTQPTTDVSKQYMLSHHPLIVEANLDKGVSEWVGEWVSEWVSG